MKKKEKYVFFDANIIIAAGQPPGGYLFRRLSDLVSAGFISVITTDLTLNEVAKKHTTNEYDVIKEVGRPHFRNLIKKIFEVSLPEMNKRQIREKIFEHKLAETKKMFQDIKAKILSIDSVKPTVVFNKYTNHCGLFSGEAKKDQFPDAFIWECIKDFSKKHELIFIGKDKDFASLLRNESSVTSFSSIEELFNMLRFNIDVPEIDKFLEENYEELLNYLDDELDGWGLEVADIEGGEIEESIVAAYELSGISSFRSAKDSEEILVVGDVNMDVHISYTHPDWDNAPYDSEDKVLMPYRKVSGEKDINIKTKFAMQISSVDGFLDSIDGVEFIDDEFIWINIDSYEDYK